MNPFTRSGTGRPSRTAAVAAAALLALGLSGCGGDSGEGSATGAELSMYAWSSSPAEDEALKDAIEEYNKLGRNKVKLNILPDFETAIQTALAGGEPPDVFYVNDHKLPDLAEAGALEPIGDKIDNVDDFYPRLKEAFTYEGKFYCPPKDFSTLQLVYNVEEFEKANVEPPTTWDELADAAKKLTKPGRPGLVLNAEFYRWGPMVAAAGGWLTNDDVTEATVDSPEVVEGLEFLADLHKQGYAASPQKVGAGWGGEALGKGKAAMTIEGNWIDGAMKTDFPDVKFAVAELPEGPDGKATMLFSACYGVSAASKNKAAAIDFVNFMVSPEQQLKITGKFSVMPSRPSVSEEWLKDKEHLKAFVDGAEYARDALFVPGFKPVIDELNDGIQGLAEGKGSAKDVASRAQKVAEEVLGG